MLRNTALTCCGLLLLSACGSDSDTDMDELYKNRQLWESSNQSEYQMSFQYSAFTIGAGTYTIYVQQETVQTALYQGINGELSEYIEPDNYIFDLATVANLFDIAEDAIATAEHYEVSYDSEYGYPSKIVIDYQTNISDDEFTYIVDMLLRAGDIACTEELLPGIILSLSLQGNTEADLCEADVYFEDGSYFESSDTCFDNTFSGAWERTGAYSVTASYPGYVSQSIESVTVYPFICHVGTRNLEMELVEESP